MNGLKIIYAIFCCMLLLSSCGQTPKKITFEIPDNFQGVIFIRKKDPGDGKPSAKGELTLTIPESGVVFTKEYRVFNDWHQINVRSRNDTGKEFHLFGLGEINGDYMLYFYGSSEVYEKNIRRSSAFDLKPGRFP